MPPSIKPEAGVILFAHGARDPRWAEPFIRVAEQVRSAAPNLAVELAYLEFLTPDLASAASQLAATGATSIRVIPLFFGRGGHLREEVPRLVQAIAAKMPKIVIDLGPAAGDDDRVVAALAAFCLAEARRK
jgi:sirohydrochlorin cobaltochelatase